MQRALVFVIIMAVLLTLGGCGGSKSESTFESKATEDAVQAQSANRLADPSERQKGQGVQPGVERKVTKDVSLVIIVSNVEEAVSKIQEMVKGEGGYIENANIWQENERMQGNLTLRVPIEKLDNTLPSFESLGRVERKNITGKDVTEEYYDAAAHKTTFEKQEKRLLELMNKANTVKEMLEIENELTRVRSQIESLQARLQVLDNLTNLATVNVELRAPKNISTGETLKEPLGQRIKAGWLLGLNGMTNFVEGLIVLFVILLPYTTLFAIVGYVIYRVWRKKRTKQS